jgi:ABC-2 type transport system ATP-binding protein
VVSFSTAAVDLIDTHTLRSIDGVIDARSETGGYQLDVSELHRAVPALLHELGRRGVEMSELRTHSATLEDVFVSLTGRHLRDD